MDNKNVAAFFKLMKFGFNKCMHDTFQCGKEAIRAHSIQNSAVLDLIQKDNHVLMPRMKLVNKEPAVELASIGRNSASTFTGLCSEHDTALFKLADTQPLDVNNQEQLKQYALRALMRELHTCVEQGSRFQVGHLDNIKKGITKEGEPDGHGVAAIAQMDKAWRVFRYQGKHFADESTLKHHIIELDGQVPTVAVSSLFSVAHNDEGDIIGPMLTVVPVSAEKTIAIVTYPLAHEERINKELPGLFDESDKRTALPILILQRVENFVLSPTIYDKWSEDKKKAIVDYFTKSMIKPIPAPKDVDLSLFQ